VNALSEQKPSNVELDRIILEEILAELEEGHAWRDYTINMIGYGTQGKPTLFGLGQLITQHPTNIKRINVWLRSGYEDRKREFETQFSGLLKSSSTRGIYDRLTNIVQFHPFHRINNLGAKIVSNAQNNQEESDLLVITARYDDFNKIMRIDSNKVIVLDNENKEKVLEEPTVLKIVQTTINNSPDSYEECAEVLRETLEKRSKLEELVSGFQKRKGTQLERFSMLRDNVIGITELGKAISGYPGTVLNLVNDTEITTYGLCAEAEIPINRIFAPAENDVARLQVILRSHYEKEKNEKFIGDIDFLNVYGGHGEFITFDYKKIRFNHQPFEEVFSDSPEGHYEIIREEAMKFGTTFAKRNKRTSDDTVWCSTIPVIKGVISETPKSYRGGVFNSDFQAFTGLNFRLKAGTIIQPDAKNIEQLSQRVQDEFLEGNKTIKELTNLLIEKEYFKRIKNLELAPIPDIPKQERKGFVGRLVRGQEELRTDMAYVKSEVGRLSQMEERIEELTKELKKAKRMPDEERIRKETELKNLQMEEALTKQIDATIYLPGIQDKNNEHLKITRYSFDSNLRPTINTYSCDLRGIVKKNLTREHMNMSIHKIEVTNNQLFSLIYRGHSNKRNEYRLFSFDLKTGDKTTGEKIEPKIEGERDRRFRIEDMIAHAGDIIMSIKDANENYLATYSLKNNSFEKFMETESLVKLMFPYEGILLLTEEGVYHNETRILSLEDETTGVYQLLPKNKVLVYGVGNAVCLADLETGQKKLFPSTKPFFDVKEFGEAIQLITAVDKNALEVTNYNSKVELFENVCQPHPIIKPEFTDLNNIFIQNKNIFFFGKETNELAVVYHKEKNSYLKPLNINNVDNMGGILK